MPTWAPTATITGKAAARGEASAECTRGTHLGSGGSTHGRGSVRNWGSLPRWASGGAVAQWSFREDQDRPRQMADGLVGATKRGNTAAPVLVIPLLSSWRHLRLPNRDSPFWGGVHVVGSQIPPSARSIRPGALTSDRHYRSYDLL